MSLTYELTEKGYTILKDGKAWVVQENNNIPYPAATLAESAELHIAEIINTNTPIDTIPLEEELAQLKEKQALMQQAIDDLIMGGAL